MLGGAKVAMCTAPTSQTVRPRVDWLAIDGTPMLLAGSKQSTEPGSRPVAMRRHYSRLGNNLVVVFLGVDGCRMVFSRR